MPKNQGQVAHRTPFLRSEWDVASREIKRELENYSGLKGILRESFEEKLFPFAKHAEKRVGNFRGIFFTFVVKEILLKGRKAQMLQWKIPVMGEMFQVFFEIFLIFQVFKLEVKFGRKFCCF